MSKSNLYKEEAKRVLPVFTVCTALSRIVVFVVYLALSVKEKFGGTSWLPVPVPVNISKWGKRVRLYIVNKSDIYVLREIFVDEVYSCDLFDGVSKPEVIVDVGSNIGISVTFFALKYPKAKIFSFEPDPRAFRILAKNTKSFANVSIYKKAVASKVGEMAFYLVNKRSISSSLYERGSRQKKVIVKTIGLADIFKELEVHRVDILKVDAEGAEYEIFKNSTGKLSDVRCIVGEIHRGQAPKRYIKRWPDIFDILLPYFDSQKRKEGPSVCAFYAVNKRLRNTIVR